MLAGSGNVLDPDNVLVGRSAIHRPTGTLVVVEELALGEAWGEVGDGEGAVVEAPELDLWRMNFAAAVGRALRAAHWMEATGKRTYILARPIHEQPSAVVNSSENTGRARAALCCSRRVNRNSSRLPQLLNHIAEQFIVVG